MDLSNRVVILTGAGRGIGRITAEVLAKYGAKLILVSRTLPELEETLALISPFSPESIVRVVDIASETAVTTLVQEVNNRFGKIDALINNAGVQMPIGRLDQNDLTEWKRNIEINLFGSVNCIHAVLPYMMQKSYGKIVNFSGGGSTGPRPNFGAYAVSKTAIVRLTENLAQEYRDCSVDVNAIAPGAINTSMLDEVLKAQNLAGAELQDALKRKEKGGDDPVLAAELVAFLVSGSSDGISGKLISAKWDPWQTEDFRNLLRTDKDLGTLRRIDIKNFRKN